MANNVFQVKRTSVAGRTPNTTSSYATNTQYIAAGELALNMTDQILYTSDGTNIISVGANIVNQRITNSLTLNNNVKINWRDVYGANVSFVHQSDDNSVFYSTNVAHQPRAIWSVFANSDTSAFIVSAPAQFNSNATYNGTNIILSGSAGIVANGSLGSNGWVLTSNGTSAYWISAGASSTDVTANFAWQNTHTFQKQTVFTGNGISLVTNTGGINFNGTSDSNWRIGRNTGLTTKFYYSNNTFDIIAAATNLEGFVIGQPGGNTYLETGYAGTFTKNPIYVGNATVNVSINSTSFTGTANNATNLGGVAAASYQLNSTLAANVSILTANNANNLGGTIASSFVANTSAGLSQNTSGHFVVAGTGTVVNATGVHVNAAYIGTIAANNASYLGGTAAASYALLSGALFTGAVNATAYTIGTVWVANASGMYMTMPLSANGGTGTAGQLLYSNGTIGAPYWAAAPANYTISTGLVNTTGTITVNAAYIATIAANNASYLGGIAAASYQLNSTLNANIAGYLPTYTGVVNAASLTTGATGLGTGGLIANVTTLFIGNNTVNAVVSTSGITVGSFWVTNSTGAYTTGTVNSASHTVGTSFIANSTGVYSGVSNASSYTTTGAANVGSLNVSGNAAITGSMTISGNLTITGNSVSIGANNLVVQDAVVSLHTYANMAPWTVNDGKAVGMAFHYFDTADKQGLLSVTQSNGVLTYYNTSTDAAIADPVGNTLGTFQAGVLLAGNSTVYTTVNATNYSGTSNNALYLGGTAAASYALKADVHYIGTTSVALNRASAALSLTGVSIDGTANNSTYFNSQAATYYTNATNITTGVLPWAQAPTNTVNTSGSYTLSGNLTFTGANIQLNSASLGGTATNYVNNFIFYTNAGNASYLRFYTYRFATGGDWTGASTRIQQRIDVSDQAYIEFNPNGYSWGVGLFNNTGKGLIVDANGQTIHNANVSVTGTSKFTGVVDAASANTLNQTVTDGATITWDTSLGQIGTVTLAGNRTMAAPTNLKVTTYILHVLQDATGSRLITWNSVFKWTAGAAPVLSTGAGKRDVFSFISDGTNLYGSYLPDVR